MRFNWLFLSLLLFISAACEKKKEAAPPQRAVPVSTIKLETKTIPADFEYVGVAQSSHLVEVRARVEGYLDEIAYKEGHLVNKDDLLFQLDPRPFQASLDTARAELERTKAVLWDASRSVERLKPLYEKNAASQRDLDNAVSQELSAKADVESNKAKVVQAELNLSFTTIRSPIVGLSNRSIYREGTLITPGTTGLMTTIAVVDPIWVNFNVSSGDILKNRDEIKKGLLEYPKDLNFTVEAILADGQKFPYIGTVDFADPVLQQSTGTMLVRAIFKNPDALLRPGQFVRARAMGAIRPNALLVPQQAVQQGKKGMYVYVVNKESKADLRPIVAGGWYQNDWIVNSGLKVGEEIVVDGVNKILPGALVQVNNQPKKKAETSKAEAPKTEPIKTEPPKKTRPAAPPEKLNKGK
ncbi:MAG: efflux RND transporter periplasmic adaptor subunit [Parachlamydiales bacterium]|jgi:membrane fusion protein (multidrug efflux system)